MLGYYKEVIELLKNGAVGFMPTDTIYGLSCVALNRDSVERIHQLKGRKHNKPLIILLADIRQAKILGLDVKDLEPLRKIWPASVTVIVTATKSPYYLHRGTNSLAVRVPDDQELRQLISQVGPVVSTSANLQGQKPAESADETKKIFGDQLDFYMDVGKLGGQPSTIARIKNGKLEIVRQGATEFSKVSR